MPVKRLLGYLKPYWVSALLAPLLMVLEVSTDLLQPRFLQSIVDVGVAKHNQAFVLHTGLTMILVALVGVIGGAGCTVYSTIAALNFSTDVRSNLFKKIQQLSFGNLDRLGTGGLITRLTNDIDQVQEAVMMSLRILVRAPLLTVGSLILAVITSPKLSLLLLIIGPVLILLLVIINRKAYPLFTSVQERLDRVNAVVQENLAGVRVVKAFARSSHECERFESANEGLCVGTVRASSLMAVILPMLILLVDLGIVGILWFGGVSVHLGRLELGQLLAFINYLMLMLGSLMMASMMLIRVSRANASAVRIAEVLDTQPDVLDAETAAASPDLKGRVVFERVGFSYDSKSGTPVLREISFSAEPGQTVAILGATGAGKSTLVNLIPRLYEVTDGRITVDGIDIRELTQDTLRRQIAVVMQDTILFSGTIRDNLRYARQDATDAEIEEAARIAQAHEFIMGFSDGYDTVLGQRGVNLSGGQKQRISIARALVARSPVLILDDCTSAVDIATERKILSALDSWSHRCTRFIIAQRIRSVVDADKVLVVEDGRLAAEGTHEELLRTSEVYQGIVQSQGNAQEVESVR
jgi:ATP-binding cassette, subfamily B, multidrug efflux pump